MRERDGLPRFKLALAGVWMAVLLFGHFEAADAAREPSSKRECAICHIMWLNDFKRSDVETLIPYDPRPITGLGKSDVVSKERMCFSCHDGYVLDSRFMWKEGTHAHPVGKKPSDKVTIPIVEGKEVFPLSDDGNLYCGTCHSAHGVDWEQTDLAVFMRMPNEKGELCIACHTGRDEGPDSGNHPVFEHPDKVADRLLKAGATFAPDGSVVCQSCHRPHGAPAEKMLALPNERSQLCGACHDDQYSENLAEAGHKGTHPINVHPEHARIPDALIEAGAKLGPDGELECRSCHEPHEAVPGTKNLVSANWESALCVSCHEQQKIVAEGKHDLRLVDPANRNVHDAPVSEAGVCSACHVPHEGTGPKMWARPLAAGDDPMAALCLSCHAPGRIAEKHGVGAFSHPVGVQLDPLPSALELPLFSSAGVKTHAAGAARVTCASCHDAHQWDPADPEHQSRPEQPGDGSNRFLRIAYGPEANLCRACHEDKLAVARSKHDMSLLAPKEENVEGQAAAHAAVCSACHLVHKGTGPWMWARKSEGHADPAAAPCLSCHEAGGVAADKRTGEISHPLQTELGEIGIEIRNSRWLAAGPDGERRLQVLPLYDGDGRHAEHGGQLSCGTCHDPHRWSPHPTNADPAPDPQDLEGGPGDSFLRIADQDQDGLCTNCHTLQAPVLDSEHDVRTLAERHHVDLEAPADASVCRGCHRPHQARGEYLWARTPVAGKHLIEGLCTDCHRDEGLAGEKLTGTHSHPLGVELGDLRPPKTLPLFAKDGSRHPDTGLIDCATCHDPHRWSPSQTAAGGAASADTEGDTDSSFLRQAASHGELCTSCHEQQALIAATEHDLRVTAPHAVNANHQTIEQSGLCGSCHAVHNATQDYRLWALQPGHGDDVMEQLCRSCHADDGPARDKAPALASHPDEVTVWSTALLSDSHLPVADGLPVFDVAGDAAGDGRISCPSCHEPHRWRPDRAVRGPGKNIEGDVLNSFLRLADSRRFICANCHGLDSLFRYQFFHTDAARKEHSLYR